jgi:hypothetical protein
MKTIIQMFVIGVVLSILMYIGHIFTEETITKVIIGILCFGALGLLIYVLGGAPDSNSGDDGL